MSNAPALAVRGATKRFGAVLALDEVDVVAQHGEVLAVLGDNGAGKSTLINCISGVHRLDAGVIEVEGEEVSMSSPAVARAAGIETVYQDLALFDNLDATANLFAGREQSVPAWLPRGMRWMRRSEMNRASAERLRRLQISLPDRASSVGMMSGGQRQAVAVAGAAAVAARRVVLGEPPAARGRGGAGQVLDLILRLRSEGCAVIVISHAMDHVMEIADRAVVMRRGRVVGEEVPRPENRSRLVSLIVGGES